jgi:hypothetical protein
MLAVAEELPMIITLIMGAAGRAAAAMAELTARRQPLLPVGQI